MTTLIFFGALIWLACLFPWLWLVYIVAWCLLRLVGRDTGDEYYQGPGTLDE